MCNGRRVRFFFSEVCTWNIFGAVTTFAPPYDVGDCQLSVLPPAPAQPPKGQGRLGRALVRSGDGDPVTGIITFDINVACLALGVNWIRGGAFTRPFLECCFEVEQQGAYKFDFNYQFDFTAHVATAGLAPVPARTFASVQVDVFGEVYQQPAVLVKGGRMTLCRPPIPPPPKNNFSGKARLTLKNVNLAPKITYYWKFTVNAQALAGAGCLLAGGLVGADAGVDTPGIPAAYKGGKKPPKAFSLNTVVVTPDVQPVTC